MRNNIVATASTKNGVEVRMLFLGLGDAFAGDNEPTPPAAAVLVSPATPAVEDDEPPTQRMPQPPAPFDIYSVHCLLASESKKRISEMCGRGQARIAAAEFVGRIIVEKHANSPEYESMLGAVLLHAQEAFRMRPKTSDEEAQRLSYQLVAFLECSDPERPKTALEPFKFTLEGVRAVLDSDRVERLAAGILGKLAATSDRYEPNEFDNLRREVKAVLMKHYLLLGNTLAEAGRLAGIIVDPQDKTRRAWPKDEKGAPVYRKPKALKVAKGIGVAPSKPAATDTTQQAKPQLSEEKREEALKAFYADPFATSAKPKAPKPKDEGGKKKDKGKNKKAERNAQAQAT